MLEGNGAMISKPTQLLQPKQAYSVMSWETIIKPIVMKEWDAKVKAEPELAKIPGAALKYRNLRIGQMYDEAPQEVKDMVEVFRQDKKSNPASTLHPLLQPHEENLPNEEKENLITVRAIQRCVIRVFLDDFHLTFIRAMHNMSDTAEYFATTFHDVTRGPVLVLAGVEDPEQEGSWKWVQYVTLSSSFFSLKCSYVQQSCCR